MRPGKLKTKKCPTCRGKGKVQPGSFLLERGVPQTCPTCKGTRRVQR